MLARRLLVLSALLPLAAWAEADVFGLGDGHWDAGVISSAVVVNSYAPLIAATQPGDLYVDVGSSTGFLPGHLMMLLQMRTDQPVDSGVQAPFDLTDAGVGRWELARIDSVSGGRLFLTAPLVTAFPADLTQAIVVPEYTSLTIIDGGTVTAPAWSGTTGGVIAVFVQQILTNEGRITADGLGYRGGVSYFNGGTPTGALDEPPPAAGLKGESLFIDSTAPSPTGSGRGNRYSGGGGGVTFGIGDHLCGAGGGHGGQGGNGFRINTTLVSLGGAPLRYPPFASAIMGGGGGAGVSDYSVVTGGAGGGIVLLRAFDVAGQGQLSSSGLAGSGPYHPYSVPGGGGAGGFISVRASGSVSCGALNAVGGNGGGGAGGGGRVLLQAADSSQCPVSVAAGVGGCGEPAGPLDAPFRGDITTLATGYLGPALPTLTFPTSGAVLPPEAVEFRGTAEPDVTISVRLDGASAGATSADGGVFDLLPASPLPAGQHLVQVSALRNGASSGWTSPIAFLVASQAQPPDGGPNDAGSSDAGTGPPVFLSHPDTAAYCGAPYRYSAVGVPELSGASPFEFSVEQLDALPTPPGLTVDPQSGELHWTPRPEDRGNQAFVLVARNSEGEARQVVAISVACGASRSNTVGCSCDTGLPLPQVLGALALAALRSRRRRQSRG